MGRFVRKGEKGIAILAPIIGPREAESASDNARTVVGFRAAYVFDVLSRDSAIRLSSPIALCHDAADEQALRSHGAPARSSGTARQWYRQIQRDKAGVIGFDVKRFNLVLRPPRKPNTDVHRRDTPDSSPMLRDRRSFPRSSTYQASGLPVTRIRSMDQILAESTARSRFDMWLMTLFGGSALLLSAIGVYGLMAYSVPQRTAEIGIRMALGADKNSVRSMVLRQGMVLAISGIIVGVVSSLSFARVLSGFLFGVAPRDPTILTAATLLLAVAFIAVWFPAQRATRLDPVTALRQE